MTTKMDANTNAAWLRKLRIAAVAGLAAVVAALAVREIIRQDKKEISVNSSMPATSSVIEPKDIDRIDLDAVTASFGYAEVSADSADSMLLSADSFAAPKSKLQPVYNAVFSDDGFQVASLADTSLMCAADAVYPLAHMLTDFYNEKNMRTVMVSSAYQAPAEPEYSYYDYGSVLEQPEPDESSTGLLIGFSLYEEYCGSREFTGAGIYSWFIDNCYQYGFVVRYPEGKEDITGHTADRTLFRYVGTEAALIMHENDLCLEELEGYLAGMSFSEPVLTEKGGRPFLIYGIRADENGSAQIRVPADPDGNAAPFKAYRCGNSYLISAELQYAPLTVSAETDMVSDEISEKEE